MVQKSQKPAASKHPKTIAVAQSKGGVGKSTTAVNLALYLVGDGELVALIDLGRQRESVDLLVDRRGTHPDLPQVVAWSPWKELPGHEHAEMRVEATKRMMAKFLEMGAHVVVDCPPVDSEDSPMVAVALAESDIVVCPFLAGGNDYKTYGRSISMAHDLKTNGKKPILLAFVNKYSSQDNDDKTMRGFLMNSGVFVYVGEVSRDVSVKRSIADQQSVWEYRSTSKGARGMFAVCKRIVEFARGEARQ